jgi:hypothetical protein
MYWCSSRQERETGIEKNQKKFLFYALNNYSQIFYAMQCWEKRAKREHEREEKFMMRETFSMNKTSLYSKIK